MLVKTFAAAIQGVEAVTITVEVDISAGINFFMVGLPDSAVKESQRRIESALKSNGFEVPRKRVVINLAPADIRKEGSAFDLPLAVGILAASGLVSRELLGDYIIMGELSLDGHLAPVRGALSLAIHAHEKGFRGIILPAGNGREASAVEGLEVIGLEDLGQVADFLDGKLAPASIRVRADRNGYESCQDYGMDMSEVKGQLKVKRALEVAAAGGHNLLMSGCPGSGKTMLARRLLTILPPLSRAESLETTRIHSVTGGSAGKLGLVVQRPFRDPHHTISDIALVGGGAWPQPGEISLAHNGVLYLDELPEFRRHVLEVLRQPMEGRTMRISRANFTIEYPASFMLVASMNPCPCGYFNHPTRECECPPGAMQKYLSRISGPLLDRIDIQIEVSPVLFGEMSGLPGGEPSEVIRARVIAARKIQSQRYAGFKGIHNNAQMNSLLMQRYCRPDTAGSSLLQSAMERLGLSARAYDRILRVARTVADLDGPGEIRSTHLAEAINYRSLDRKGWGG